MSEKTNREKMLDEEEYFPDKELADLAYESRRSKPAALPALTLKIVCSWWTMI